MFSSLKIGLVLVMLAGAGGGYLYVNKLQKDNAVLKTNQIKLETAVQESNQVIEQQTKDLKKIRSTLKKVEEVNAKLQADRAALEQKTPTSYCARKNQPIGAHANRKEGGFL